MSSLAGAQDTVRRTLPVAGTPEVIAHARFLARTHRGGLATTLLWHSLAAAAALLSPWLVGRLLDEVTGGTSRAVVDRYALLLLGAVLAQTVLTWLARRRSVILGEALFDDLRRGFVRDAVRLPLSTLERAGTGDLVARTTNDVEALAQVARLGVPAILVAAVTVTLTTIAAVLTAPLVALAGLLALIMVPATRRYLRLARDGYLWERGSYARLNAVAAESIDGAATIDALALGRERHDRLGQRLRDCWDAEQYTLGLRLRWMPWVEVGYLLPAAAALVWGGWLAAHGHTGIGGTVAVVLYLRALVEPLDQLLMWLDEIQVGATSLARIIGIAEVPPDRTPTGDRPVDDRIAATAVRYAYRPGHDVLHGVDLRLQPGERLAVVGPDRKSVV